MEIADRRASGASPGARRSLRAFKQSPQYRAMLENTLARKETASMSSQECRRIRLDRVLADLELDKLKRGETLNEFTGVLAINDPLRFMLHEVDE